MAYFATEYTIHFDDTMAYGSHHFLTAFKWQCASREAFLFGERIFDMPGVKHALDQIHLLTVEAYARNLSPARLGDRLAILLSLEQWGQASARFCYRVIGQQGQAVCAGYQTLVCADAHTQLPVSMPAALQQAMNAMREIEEPWSKESFRDRVLAGGTKLDGLFGAAQREASRQFLSQRYPSPQVVQLPAAQAQAAPPNATHEVVANVVSDTKAEAWLFGGQATFDARLFSQRLSAYAATGPAAREQIGQSRQVAASLLDSHSSDLFFNGSEKQCQAAVQATPAFSQVGIYWQNVLGAKLWSALGHTPRVLLGHSFGETAALSVAGCFDLATGTRIVCARIQAVADLAPADGGLLVVSAGGSTVEAEVRLLGLDEVVLAGRNHPTQVVMSGPMEQLQRLRSHLQTKRVSAIAIDSPTSFHHPHLQAAASQWLAALRKLPLQPASLAVYSAIHQRMLTAGDDIASILSEQLTKPFDFQAAIAELLRGGLTSFVDCGSPGIIARLVSKAGADPQSVHCVAAEAPAATMTTATMPAASAAPAGAEAVRATSKSTATESTDRRIPRVAIVGTGCILPAGVTSPSELFTAIAEQRLGIVDQQLFDPHWADDFYSAQLKPDRSNSHLFGRVLDSGLTVPNGVDPQIFDSCTRTQKLLCIALAPCIDALRGAERIVCLLGSTADGFEDQDEVASLRLAGIDPSHPEVDRRMHTARSAGHTPHSAVQQVFDLLIRPKLQVILIDAACASSLYSLTLGMQMLEGDRVDAVIAGGFFCPGPGNSCLFSQFRGTTSTGCRPFDAHADGVVFSEGAALVALRRVADVERYGLTAQAIVAGAGLSSDGKSPSANVPQTRGQLLAVERCYANYDIDPSSITAIEGHGTSTPVGDGTEVETLRRFFAGQAAQPIPVHSLKGLLGHAGWAAGTASVIAVCEYMRNGLFPAQAMFRQPSSAMLEAAGTLFVPTSPIRLASPTERIAIDGFGFGGANAHLVLEKYCAEVSTSRAVRASSPCSTESTTVSVKSACSCDTSGSSHASESVKPSKSSAATMLPSTLHTNCGRFDSDEELVIVAYHCEWPTDSSQFDRSQIKAPPRHVILPQLADDMDISQALAIRVAGNVLGRVPQLNAALQRETSLVLAMSGKTQRSIEATLRILAPRLRRLLPDDETMQLQIDKTYRAARPSGPYTLQCMMPNVAAGRSALLLNLNGPNFVVDAGRQSLAAAFTSAASLLSGGDHSGTKLVVVAAIAAQSDLCADVDTEADDREVAAAFLVTNRRFAKEFSLPVVSSLEAVLPRAECEPSGLGEQQLQPMLFQQVQEIQAALDALGSSQPADISTTTPTSTSTSTATASSISKGPPKPPSKSTSRIDMAALTAAQNLPTTQPAPVALPAPITLPQRSASSPACQLYAPMWIDKPLADTFSQAGELTSRPDVRPAKHMLVIVQANFSGLSELPSALAEVVEKFTLAVVGETASSVVSANGTTNWIAIDMVDPTSLATAVDKLCSNAPDMDVVSIVDEAISWELLPTLATLAHDNSLCELLFLVAQHQSAQLRSGSLELWGLFLEAWNGEAHPSTGPTAGLLKSIQREFPAARTGTICTQRLNISAALKRLRMESAHGDREAEVVYALGRRMVRRLRLAVADSTKSPQWQVTPQVELNKRSIVVAAGGAKGVTAVMLDALLSDHQCTAIAIGRSPLEAGPDNIDSPEVEQAYYAHFMRQHPGSSAAKMKRSFEAARGRWEAHQTIQRLRLHGGQVEYIVADVTDATQMATVVEQIVADYGQIDLLLYGAGVQTSKRLEDRSLADFRTVFSAKVTGLHNLVNACSTHLGHRVPAHVLTSAYSVFGNDGQHDYGAANETLDRLCSLTQFGGARPDWTSIAWLAWDAIGMTRGSEYRALAKKRRLSGVDPITGQQLFRQVIGGESISAINVPLSDAEHVEYAVQTIPQAPAQLSGRVAGRVVELSVPLANMTCLPFHQVRNVPTLPGAWIVDVFVGAARRLAEGVRTDMHVVIEDLNFSKFVRLAHDHEPNVRVIAQQCGQAIAVWMLTDIVHSSGALLAKDQVCASATITFGCDELLSSLTMPLAEYGSAQRAAVQDPYCQKRDVVQLSGLFDCLSGIELHEQIRCAKFGSAHSPASYHHIPALLLDAAWRVGAMHTPARSEDLFVPTKVGRITLPLDSLPPAFASPTSLAPWEIRSTTPRAGGKQVRWDRTEVYNPLGHLKIVIENAWANSLT